MTASNIFDPSSPMVSDFGDGHVIEYFTKDGETWIRETRNGRTLEQRLMDAVKDPWARLEFFSGVEPNPHADTPDPSRPS